jgi:hypothetical protein
MPQSARGQEAGRGNTCLVDTTLFLVNMKTVYTAITVIAPVPYLCVYNHHVSRMITHAVRGDPGHGRWHRCN